MQVEAVHHGANRESRIQPPIIRAMPPGPAPRRRTSIAGDFPPPPDVRSVRACAWERTTQKGKTKTPPFARVHRASSRRVRLPTYVLANQGVLGAFAVSARVAPVASAVSTPSVHSGAFDENEKTGLVWFGLVLGLGRGCVELGGEKRREESAMAVAVVLILGRDG